MMKRVTWCLLALCCNAMLFAEVKPGMNILANGQFEADQTDFPSFWAVQGDTRYCTYNPSAGPKGMPAIRLYCEDGACEEVSCRQFGLGLKEKETYRISAWIRTKGFKSPHYGISVANHGWMTEIGLSDVKENQDWTYMEKTLTMVPSVNGTYFAVIFACRFKGELQVADLKLEAISEGALKNSQLPVAAAIQMVPRVVPWEPLLHRIPADKPEMTFRFFGKLEEGENKDYDLTLAVSDTRTEVRAQLGARTTTVALPQGAKQGNLKVALVHRQSGKTVYETAYPYSVVSIPEVFPQAHRRLNNLCTEILNAPLAAKDDMQTLDFATVRDGWVFIKLETPVAGRLEVLLDDKLTVIDAATPRLETFRHVAVGNHTLTVGGASRGGKVIVRSIVDLFNYCPGANSGVGENPPYNWDFQMKYVLPAVTTQNGGSIPEEQREWFRRQGYRWLANLGSVNLKDGADLVERFDKNSGMKASYYDGVTCDEQFFNDPASITRYTDGLRAYANPNNRLIYTWIVGKPGAPGIDHEFMAASVNASQSRGKVLFEAYCRTKATEAEARNYLDMYVTETLRKYKDCYPHVEESTGIIFGNFNQVPILSLAHHPAVDYKYYLDMQLNLVANSPEFANIGCTGYWGSYYADHELHRWAFMLLRHYAVEGKTSMLSAEHGFSYLPGHLQNGDFSGELSPWNAMGNVRADKFNGFASTSQNRWGGNGGVGDTFAVLDKRDGENSTLSQTAANLVPGRAYCLQFATFDVKDVKAKKINPRQFGITATLSSGAKVRGDLSWLHVDKRINGRYAHNNGVARINLHHIVFIATKPEVTVTFDNSKALPGEELGINYVSLNPFLLEK